MNNTSQDRADLVFKKNWSVTRFLVCIMMVFSLTRATHGAAQTSQGDEPNPAFELLLKRYAPSRPLLILTADHYALWMPSPSDETLSITAQEPSATDASSLSTVIENSSEEDQPLWSGLDQDESGFGIDVLENTEITFSDAVNAASEPMDNTQDLKNQLQALVPVAPETDKFETEIKVTVTPSSGTIQEQSAQETKTDLRSSVLAKVAEAETTTSALNVNASAEIMDLSTVASAPGVPPTPVPRPEGKEAQRANITLNAPSATESQSYEVVTGSAAQTLYDQLISTSTTRGSRRADRIPVDSTFGPPSPDQVSPSARYTLNELNAMTPTERWDAIMGGGGQ